jgi:cytochrome c-type biogenesis protein
MFDQFLLTINAWMLGGFSVAVLGCLLWGLVSILLSPCHLASIPLIIGYVAGHETLVQGRQAAGYALLFGFGLFLSITAVGAICSMLGRMLGDVSPYWSIPIGGLFIWLGLSLMGVSACKLPTGNLRRFQMRGYPGAFVLGLTYGIVSGACTFGFIAPILAIITVQEEMVKGMSLLLFFALGHCLPIVAAGSSAALAQRLLTGKGIQTATIWGRRIAGGLVVAIGVYFVLTPFWS